MREIQHAIDFVPRAVIPNHPTYLMAPKEYAKLQRQVDELIASSLVRPSTSTCAILALLVPKKDGSWWMYIDSCVMNNITIKYCFPIPRLNYLFDKLHKDSYFSRINLRRRHQ